MTCIVAMKDRETGDIWMGGDSAGVQGVSLTIRADEKVFENGPYIFGFTSSFRMGNLLRYAFSPPQHPFKMGSCRFMATIFIDALRDCLKSGGYARVKDNAEAGGEFLVGYRGAIYSIHSDFQIGRVRHPFATCGSGGRVAIGALMAMDRIGQPADTRSRVVSALKIAEAATTGVRGPFRVICQKRNVAGEDKC